MVMLTLVSFRPRGSRGSRGSVGLTLNAGLSLLTWGGRAGGLQFVWWS